MPLPEKEVHILKITLVIVALAVLLQACVGTLTPYNNINGINNSLGSTSAQKPHRLEKPENIATGNNTENSQNSTGTDNTTNVTTNDANITNTNQSINITNTTTKSTSTPNIIVHGLLGSYFNSTSGNKVLVRVDPNIQFFWNRTSSPGPGVPDSYFSAVWQGNITPPKTGTYTFNLFLDDGARLYINGTNILPSSAWAIWAQEQNSSPIFLQKGENYTIRVEFFQHDWNSQIDLNWTLPGSSTSVPVPESDLTAANKSTATIPFGATANFTDKPKNPGNVVSTFCGNKITEGGEQCDNGSNNGVACNPAYGSSCTYCTTSCMTITLKGDYCGDRIKQGSEQCDNGAQNGVKCNPPTGRSCNYCTSSCKTSTVVSTPSASTGYQMITYSIDTNSNIENPDRGWYKEISNSASGYQYLYGTGYSMAMIYVRLDNYRSGSLPQSFLDALRKNLSNARSSGVKIVLRFAYNRDGTSPDASYTTVTQQLNQLAPILSEYSDVISVLQTGFIGSWGEWHGSTNNLIKDVSNRHGIMTALMQNTPATMMVDFRAPWMVAQYQNQVLGTTSDVPVSYSQRFDGSTISRMGLHNDCFMTDKTDTGTYSAYDWNKNVDTQRQFASQEGSVTAVGGETCDVYGLSSWNDCSNTITQMETFHWDYLNVEYWTPMINKWKNQGCYNEITNRLGYRIALINSTLPSSASASSNINVAFRMQNSGFGKVYNPRPMYLVLKGSSGTYKVQIYNDARKYLPLGGETVTISKTITLPSNVPAGSYHMYLWLPSYYSVDQNNPLYSIHLANTGVWGSSTGYNDLNADVSIG